MQNSAWFKCLIHGWFWMLCYVTKFPNFCCCLLPVVIRSGSCHLWAYWLGYWCGRRVDGRATRALTWRNVHRWRVSPFGTRPARPQPLQHPFISRLHPRHRSVFDAASHPLLCQCLIVVFSSVNRPGARVTRPPARVWGVLTSQNSRRFSRIQFWFSTWRLDRFEDIWGVLLFGLHINTMDLDFSRKSYQLLTRLQLPHFIQGQIFCPPKDMLCGFYRFWLPSRGTK